MSGVGIRADFDWQDPFSLSGQLSETELMLQDSARRFCDSELMPRICDAYRREDFDVGVMRAMGTQGFLGATLPEKYGGSGITYNGYGLIAREVERVDSGYRSAMSVQSSLVMHAIYAFGDEQQRKHYLPRLASGELIGCFALTESEHGSDPAGMLSRAEKVSDGYLLDARKSWISHASIADVAIIWAKLEGEIRGFIVEAECEGVSRTPIKGKLALRASPTGDIACQNVKLAESALLPSAKGLKAPFACLNRARFSIAWGALGAAEFCWHAARQYTLDRRQFNRPLAANQLIQKKLADMQTEIHIGLQACLRVGQLLDEDKCSPEAISIIKRNSCLKALDIARTARDMHGGNGISDEYHVMRHMCNLEAVNTYEGTADIHALILGRAQTNIQAFF